jgi:hypothetical protein
MATVKQAFGWMGLTAFVVVAVISVMVAWPTC